MEMPENQGSLFDIYSELTQPEDCLDCESRLDGRDLKVSWDYCEYCSRSICTSCDTLHACEAMRRSRPKPG
jgi:hypothetical protein